MAKKDVKIERSRRKSDERSRLEQGRFAAVRARDINVLPRCETDVSVYEFLERRPELIIKNISILLNHYDMSADAAPGLIEVDGRWFRRLLKRGLVRRMPNLDKVARFFGLPDGDYLWHRDILSLLGPPPPRPETLGSWSKMVNWPYALRLLELLETGQHDYLTGLIDGLHQLTFAREVTASRFGGVAEAGPVASSEARTGDGLEVAGPLMQAFVMPDDEEREDRLDKWFVED